MIITPHGKRDPLFKGVAKHQGRRLVFFGWSPAHVERKEQEWLLRNQPVEKARERNRPKLRIINGGKSRQRHQGASAC